MEVKHTSPLLPLRDIVVFPSMVIPLFVGRDKSITALNEVMKDNKKIILVTQKNSEVDDPKKTDVFMYGCECSILQLLKLPDGTVKVLAEGTKRVKIINFKDDEKFITCSYEYNNDPISTDEDLMPLAITAVRRLEKLTSINKKISSETISNIKELKDPSKIADNIASHLNTNISEKQQLFETIDVKKRLNAVIKIMENETSIIGVEKKIRGRVKTQMEKTQREYYLNEQLKAIQKELGEIEDGKDETSNLNKAIQKAKMPEEVHKKCMSELKKLKNMSPMSAEATVVRNYLDWMIDIPWYKKDKVDIDLNNALKTLDEDHYGLEKVKERIIEYLAVRNLKQKRNPDGNVRGPILCFGGPPGVGKTSLGKSIARAMGREFIRLSLGGVRDEAEIRGHRRTYIGALPGRIILNIKKAGTNNPVFMLDEVDKLGSDFRGDPSSALLEVLDPEQNHSFNDHYLELDFDLSKVMFIATANNYGNVPPALRDRMEILEFSGYIQDEKVLIAKRHLIPKQVKENGLKKTEVSLDLNSIKELISGYTREAGVRQLEREIANVLRKVAREIVESKVKHIKVNKTKVHDLLGASRFHSEIAERTTEPGVVTGLAWTAAGGDILFIESTKMKGKGKLILTGQLGDVMKESATAGLTFVRAHAKNFGIAPNFNEETDIHVHVPAGAIPKDGPSAGVSMVTSLVSLMTNTQVKERVAMTGEITLRGNVLPIGGVKEKVTAAHRAGIKEVILPDLNRKDLEDVPEHVSKDLTFHFAKEIWDVLSVALPGVANKKSKNPQVKKNKKS